MVTTGGTGTVGGAELGAVVVEVACVLELKELKGRDKLGVPLFAIALLSEFTDEAAADGAH
jgi:adenine/guanine phosphoribosyltransferase-like PRPP-binding protein